VQVRCALGSCGGTHLGHQTRKIDETITIHEALGSRFSGAAGLGLIEAEVRDHLEREVCLSGKKVIEYSAGILSYVPNQCHFEGRCG
jgi:hypothetical protein